MDAPILLAAVHNATTPLSRLIRWRQWGRGPVHVAHVEEMDGPRPGRVIEAWWPRVRHGDWLDAHHQDDEISLHAIPATPDQRQAFHEFMLAQVGRRYDLLGLVGFMALRADIQERDAWFCSELIAAAARAARIPLFNWDEVLPAQITPALLLASCLVRRMPGGGEP